VPTLTPVTFLGAINPLPAPDGQKIVFAVANATTDAKNGLYVLDLSDRPFGLNSDPRQITRTSSKYNLVTAQLTWSPDSSQILAVINQGEVDETTVLLDQSRFNDIAELNDVSARLPLILAEWQEVLDKKTHEKIIELPELMQSVASESAAFAFAPEPEKLLYVPNQETTLPVDLIPALPASSTQTQQRQIKPDNIYVYDLKEDKNFWIATVPATSKVTAVSPLEVLKKRYFPPEFSTIQWYPDSRHLLMIEDTKVVIAEYDGTNRHTVYAGPFSGEFAYPWSNGSSLIILASLNGGSNLPPNLYSINLK
jgi:Tol biopolymer transport system component